MQFHSTLTKDYGYKEIIERLSKLSTPILCDVLPAIRLMDSTIIPIGESKQCIGRAYTVNSDQDSLSIMKALDDLPAFLALLNGADSDIVPTILTIAACGAPYALAGGMCANAAKMKGFGGVIIDGFCRDIGEIEESGLPFFAKGKCAKSGPKNKIGTVKEKIQCGGVEVNPGDIIFADRDGIVVMNKEEAIIAVTKGEAKQMQEDLALQKIREGASVSQVCNGDATQ